MIGRLLYMCSMALVCACGGMTDDDSWQGARAVCADDPALHHSLTLAIEIWNARITEDETIDDPPRGYLDLPTVLAHELGHVLGLDNTEEPADLMFPTMPAPGTTKRRLSIQDVEAFNATDAPDTALMLVDAPPCDVTVEWRELDHWLAEASRSAVRVDPSWPWYVPLSF